MRYNILIGGKAGQGIRKVADIVSSTLAAAGFYLFNYKDYQSIIRGGHNFNIISISDKPIYSHQEKIDVLLCLDHNTYGLHRGKLKPKAVVACSWNEKDGIFLDVEKLGRNGNMAFIAFLFKVVGIPLDFVVTEMESKFRKKEVFLENKEVLETFYNNSELSASFSIKPGKPIQYISGSEAVAKGAIAAKLEIYFGYPMTPSTPLLTLLAQKAHKMKGLFVFTPENEIAVINAALGASFSGKRTMVATSGGGFDLMTEGLSLQGMCELPLVINLVARAGPASGVPTYTAQADLNIALYSGHGDFPRIVIAPGDIQEAYDKVHEAFYLTEKFGVPVILLTDKHLAESGFTQNITPSNLQLPARVVELGKKIFKRSSYEHDANWNTTEDAVLIKARVEGREKKKVLITKEVKKFRTYQVYGSGDKLLVGFGSTKGVLIDALDLLPGFKYLHLIYVEPFPLEVLAELKKAKEVYCVENNSSGQLAGLIAQKLLFKIENFIRKYDGRPFTADEIVNMVLKKSSGLQRK